MLIKTSKEFRKFFLLEFTREIIKHSRTGEILQLKQMIQEEEKEKKKKNSAEKEIFAEPKKISEESRIIQINAPAKPMVQQIRPNQIRVLRIPEVNLPPSLQYLKPTPTKMEIDLGRLNPLIKDPLVKEIQCDGPEENIIVRGNMGTKPTSIVMKREEIDSIIKKFSEASRIPTNEGLYKVVAGKLIFSAIISEVIGSKFVIKKMIYYPGPIER